jgi:superfamily II DNA helicase RecQ
MARKKAITPDIAAVAREKLGFESLRPGQQEAVEALLNGHDTLVVHPTGSGKSAIYQIAGLLIAGSTVIVSPLIALQKDQVDSIGEQSAAPAVAVNSTEKLAAVRERLELVGRGQFEYVFLALIPSTYAPEKVPEFGKSTSFGRPAQPAEIAPAYVFLASNDATYMTGEVIGVTGGRMPF